MRRPERFVLALLIVYLLREVAMIEEWDTDADPGDETDEDYEYDIDFQPDAGLAAALDDEIVCPRGHRALLRESDGAIWCLCCDEAFFRDFAGLIYPRRALDEAA